MTTIKVIIQQTSVTDAAGTQHPRFVAIGISHFLVGQGETREAAEAALDQAIIATVLANNALRQPPLHGIKPAPQRYQDRAAEIGPEDWAASRTLADQVELIAQRQAA